MQATSLDSAEPRRETAGFVVRRVVAGLLSDRRYVQSVHTRHDGAIAALAYGPLGDARIFDDRRAAQRFAARLAESRVFGAQPHLVEPLANAAEATA